MQILPIYAFALLIFCLQFCLTKAKLCPTSRILSTIISSLYIFFYCLKGLLVTTPSIRNNFLISNLLSFASISGFTSNFDNTLYLGVFTYLAFILSVIFCSYFKIFYSTSRLIRSSKVHVLRLQKKSHQSYLYLLLTILLVISANCVIVIFPITSSSSTLVLGKKAEDGITLMQFISLRLTWMISFLVIPLTVDLLASKKVKFLKIIILLLLTANIMLVSLAISNRINLLSIMIATICSLLILPVSGQISIKNSFKTYLMPYTHFLVVPITVLLLITILRSNYLLKTSNFSVLGFIFYPVLKVLSGNYFCDFSKIYNALMNFNSLPSITQDLPLTLGFIFPSQLSFKDVGSLLGSQHSGITPGLILELSIDFGILLTPFLLFLTVIMLSLFFKLISSKFLATQLVSASSILISSFLLLINNSLGSTALYLLTGVSSLVVYDIIICRTSVLNTKGRLL